MKATHTIPFFVTILLVWNGASEFVLATDPTDAQIAYEAVQSGIQEFESGHWDAAAKKFEEAIALSENNTVIQFDQACVDLAQGAQDHAKEKLRQAVSGSDPQVVQSAHYNLGFLKVQQVKEKLQPNPATVEKKVRTEVVDQLEQAARHFRHTLEINSDHEDAAYNLELIRLYLKRLKTMWKQQDEQQEQQQEQEESLPDFLLRLQDELKDAEQRIAVLQDEQDSTSRKTAVADLQIELSELDTDVKKMRPMVAEFLQSVVSSQNGQAPNQSPPEPTAEEAEAIQAVNQLVDQVEALSQDMLAAVATEDWSQGQLAIDQNIKSIYQMFAVVTPYPKFVQTALEKQQKLNSATAQLPFVQPSTGQSLEDLTPPLLREQQLISYFSQVLQHRAAQELPAVEQKLAQRKLAQRNQAPAPAAGAAAGAAQPAPPQASVLQPDEEIAILEGSKESMLRAIQLGPDAVRYAEKSTGVLQAALEAEDKAEHLLPEQMETLNWAQGKVSLLLQDIIEPLLDPDQQQSGEQQSDQQGDQDSEEGQQQSEDQNSGQQDSEGDSSESEQSEPNDPNGDDSQQSDDSHQDESSDDERQPLPEMAERQAEAILRKALEREQEYRELKRRQQKRTNGEGVKKDW